MMVTCIKQHLTNIWNIHEKVKQHWGLIEKQYLLIKKADILSIYTRLNNHLVT